MLEFIVDNFIFILLIGLTARYALIQKRVTPFKVVLYIVFLFYMYQVLLVTGLVNILSNSHMFDVSASSLSYSFKNSQFIPFLFLKEGLALNDNDFIKLLFSSYFRSSLYNFIMLIPFGIFIPWLYRFKFNVTFFSGLTLVCVIEIVQFISNVASLSSRSFNIDDFILNLLGVIVGYLLFVGVVKKIVPAKHTK